MENNKSMTVKAAATDINDISHLASLLWEECSEEQLRSELENILADDESAVFVFRDCGRAVGFAYCTLRHDYVEGTERSPVGYLEGIFVAREYRGRGIARALLGCCEEWSAQMGCTEFASDCETTNSGSLGFHLKTGFSEANRIICFVKKL